MSRYALELANAIAAMTRNVVVGLPAPAAMSGTGRPRTISEILDLSGSFVALPQDAAAGESETEDRG